MMWNPLSRAIAASLMAVLFAGGLTACQQSGSSESGSSESPVASASPSPSQIFPDNFAQVCNGAPLTAAAAYSKTPGTVHPILAFVQEDANRPYSKSYTTLPQGWELEWTQVQKTELVACLKVTNRELADKCEFKPDEPGKPAYTLEIYNTQYEVSLYAAQSGELLKSETFDLKAGECPMFHMFTEGEPVDTLNASYEQPLTDFIKPFVVP